MRIARWGLGHSAAVVLAVAAGMVGTAAPAQAADSTCTFTRTLCLWENTDFTGTRYTVQAKNSSTGTCVNLEAHGWGTGRTESARNTANLPATLYSGSNCTGTPYLLQPGGAYSPISFTSNSVHVH